MSIPRCVNSLFKSVCDHICLFDVFECRFVRCADDEEEGASGVFLGLASPEPPGVFSDDSYARLVYISWSLNPAPPPTTPFEAPSLLRELDFFRRSFKSTSSWTEGLVLRDLDLLWLRFSSLEPEKKVWWGKKNPFGCKKCGNANASVRLAWLEWFQDWVSTFDFTLWIAWRCVGIDANCEACVVECGGLCEAGGGWYIPAHTAAQWVVTHTTSIMARRTAHRRLGPEISITFKSQEGIQRAKILWDLQNPLSFF